METRFFNALCDLFNEGEAIVRIEDAFEFAEIAQRVFPDSVICGGALIETNGKVTCKAFYIDTPKNAK